MLLLRAGRTQFSLAENDLFVISAPREEMETIIAETPKSWTAGTPSEATA